MTSHVEQQIAARIAVARRRAEEQRKRREELAAAREMGLGFRHAQRLRNFAEAALDNSSLAPSGA
ncbi:hypothetical protein ABZ835_37635 [Streptomyces sp. NPDC047461]|uniref:hypothetical protein n=1 Tax=Streptomyces sp. NPDC047461 TaxID=3155619 RepID=UPI0033FB665F